MEERKKKMNEIKERVFQIIKSSFPSIDDFNINDSNLDLVKNLGMDSLTFVEMIILIEEEFNIEIPFEILVINNFNNIDSIANVVKKALIDQYKK